MAKIRRSHRKSDEEGWSVVLLLSALALIVCYYKSSEKQPLDPPPLPAVVWLTEENGEFLKPAVSVAERTIVCYSESSHKAANDYFSTLKVDIRFDSEAFELYEGVNAVQVLENFKSNTPGDFRSELKGKSLEIPVKGSSCVGIKTKAGYRATLVVDNWLFQGIILFACNILAPIIFMLMIPVFNYGLWLFTYIIYKLFLRF